MTGWSCPYCAHALPADPEPVPHAGVCARCGEPLCPHCCADPTVGLPYRHAAAYCTDAEEETEETKEF